MVTRDGARGFGRFVARLAGLGCGALLAMSLGHATTLTAGQEPQILIIIDNSQGMAGDLQGAIMTGSGTVAANAGPLTPPSTPPLAWPSPVCYPLTGGYSPRMQTQLAYNGSTCPAGYAPYTVSNGGAEQDNSESMINIAEQSLWDEFNNASNANTFQVGLMDYATAGTPTVYPTWVYYMSNNDTLNTNNQITAYGAFQFGTAAVSPSTTNPVAAYNPCYQSTSAACHAIARVMGAAVTADPYLYMNATSDDPEINDVLYAFNGLPDNILTYGGPSPYPPSYTLTQYEDQIVNNAPLYETYQRSTGGVRATSPTSAGYAPYSGQVWYARRGSAYDGMPVTSENPISPPSGVTGTWGQGDLLVPVAPFAQSLAAINSNLAAEEFPAGSGIVAGSEYAPMAGALQSALSYFTGPDGPTPTCAHKYVILITDGQPTMGLQGHVYPPLGSAAATTYGETAQNDQAVNEAITAVTNLAKNTANGTGPIKTYVLGVGPNINCPPSDTTCPAEAAAGYTVLQELAQAGGTQQAYSAQSPTQFQQAFGAILNNIEGQVLTSNAGSSSNLTTNALEYAASSTPALGEGNLTAYAVQPNGNVASTASWDVESLTALNPQVRQTNLYSTGPATATNPYPITNFMSMDAAAFGTLPTGLTVSDIENYTVNPNYQGGTYLGGRGASWYIGITSPLQPVVVGPPSDGNLLSYTSYDSFAQQENTREPLALFGDNDGFLYAVDATTGALVWGWMPRPLVASLQNYSTFWQNGNMSEGVRAVDAEDANGAWWTYLVGIGGGGSIQYALQLNTGGSNGSAQAQLAQQAWEVDNPNATEPNPGVPVIIRELPAQATGNPVAYLATVLSVTSGSTASSVLDLTDVGTGVLTSYTLPFAATTQPYLDLNGNIFIGDSASNVWEAPIFTANGSFSSFSRTATWTPLNSSAADPASANFGTTTTSTGGASALVTISGAYYNGIEYLSLQTATRLTMLQDGAQGWQPLWTTAANTGDAWNATTGSYQANSAVASLPANAVITDSPLITNAAVVLPVTVPPSDADTDTNNPDSPTNAEACATPSAWLYFYSLPTGVFPAYTFQDMQGNFLTGPVEVGSGTAFTPALAMFDGQLRLQTAASLGPAPASGGGGGGGGGGGTGGNGPPPLGQALAGAGPAAEGPAGWREVFLP